MATIVENVHSRCDDPSLDPSGLLTVRVKHSEGSSNFVECTLSIDPWCGQDNALYDCYLYIAGEGPDGAFLGSETRNDTVLYSEEKGVLWPVSFSASSYPWISQLVSGGKVVVYATFTHHFVPSISCVFPRTEIDV